MTGDPADQTQPLVTINDARVRINRHRVLAVEQFAIAPGEHWCVLGGNGAGKSLLARLIRGELTSGRQHVAYAPGFLPAEHLEVVSFEEQQRLWALDNRRDISEYNAEAKDPGTTVASLIGVGHDPALLGSAAACDLLDRLALRPLLERGIRFLSSGQIRKVMVARALLRRQSGPGRLLVLDDPLEAIDRQAAPVVRDLLQGWMTGREHATLLLCRREREILPGITHLAILEDLKLVCQGPLSAVTATPAYARVAHPRVTAPRHLPGAAARPTPQSAVDPIRLHEVTAGYGERPVLNRVSWVMGPTDHTLIEGPNGCGKSTLLSLIDGENHKAYGQQVFLFGVRRGSGETVWDIKSHFGIVSNEIHNRYVKGWRVIDVVVSGFFDSVGLYDDSGGTQEETAKQWLAALNLLPIARDYFHEVSFGQQRLVLLARAMVKQPAVLILDEPCVGLDDYYRQLVLATVDRIAEQAATQIIYVSHTEGEEPRCITQRLRFEPAPGGGHTLVEYPG